MFDKVAIVGLGLLGGSLARDLQQHGLAKTVVGVCRSPESTETARRLKLVDEVCNLHSAVENADLIVLATPMQSMISVIEEIQSSLSAGALITDVGSVKTDLYTGLKSRCPAVLERFVLAHPIAGGEDSGAAASRTDLFKNKHVIITHTDEVSPAQVQKIENLWQAVGANVLKMSLQQHDAIFAKTSHLPHVVAYTLVNYLNSLDEREQLFDLAAAGFYDFSRIASSNAEMWRDICITNQAEIVQALDGFQHQLQQIRDKIAEQDQVGILAEFSDAKSARDAGLLKKRIG